MTKIEWTDVTWNPVTGCTKIAANEASARSSMSLWLREGKIDGVRCENDGRRLRLFPVKENE